MTVQQMGWSGVKNGRLLQQAASAGFEVIVTVNQNMQYEQNLAAAPIAVVLLVTSRNRLQELLPLVDRLALASSSLQPGDFLRIM